MKMRNFKFAILFSIVVDTSIVFFSLLLSIIIDLYFVMLIVFIIWLASLVVLIIKREWIEDSTEMDKENFQLTSGKKGSEEKNG